MFINSNYISTLFLLFSLFFSLQLEAKIKHSTDQTVEIVERAKKSPSKLPRPEWGVQIKDDDLYFSTLVPIKINSLNDIKKRYNEMVHSLYLRPNHTDFFVKKIFQLSTYAPKIATYVKKSLSTVNDVEHISVYGSFLYNSIDPDDIDILLIVSSPIPIYWHQDTTIKEISGEDIPFPKLSLLVLDHESYTSVKEPKHPSTLTTAQKLALQHLSMAGSWYLTIYGYEFRMDNLNDLKEHTKLNYLYKSVQSLNAAGTRLYRSAYEKIPYENDRIRLRKVVSRILITDFLFPILDSRIKPNPDIYKNLQDDIRSTNLHDDQKWSYIEKRVEKLYFHKLEELLRISEKYGKLHEISFSDKE